MPSRNCDNWRQFISKHPPKKLAENLQISEFYVFILNRTEYQRTDRTKGLPIIPGSSSAILHQKSQAFRQYHANPSLPIPDHTPNQYIILHVPFDESAPKIESMTDLRSKLSLHPPSNLPAPTPSHPLTPTYLQYLAPPLSTNKKSIIYIYHAGREAIFVHTPSSHHLQHPAERLK